MRSSGAAAAATAFRPVTGVTAVAAAAAVTRSRTCQVRVGECLRSRVCVFEQSVYMLALL